jgi:hypothetical protein
MNFRHTHPEVLPQNGITGPTLREGQLKSYNHILRFQRAITGFAKRVNVNSAYPGFAAPPADPTEPHEIERHPCDHAETQSGTKYFRCVADIRGCRRCMMSSARRDLPFDSQT